MQLADSCLKLHKFWSEIREAPAEVAMIMEDLMLLSKVLKEVASHDPVGPTASVLSSCAYKIKVVLNLGH